jgi:DNA polymerase type B, organellar and viral
MKNNNRFSYTPLKFNENLNLISLASLDIETFEDQYSKEQIPLCITACIKLNSNVSNNLPKFAEICITLDGELFNSSILNREKALSKFWKSFWNSVNKICLNEGHNKVTFMVHNLGKFDGSFLIKGLMYAVDYNLVKTLIDNQHKFITISAPLKNVKIVLRDSYRIFPVSLQELCSVFKVKGKFGKYNQEFNKLSILKTGNPLHKQFLSYARQDSFALLQAMSKAQNIYFEKHKIDICSIVSTASLSLKIFRTNYLNFNIPVLNNTLDKFIRFSYYGGATDYYKKHGKDLYYYDVNSLYPYVMLKNMPYKPLKWFEDLSETKLEDFFGFALARIECSNNVKLPILPFKSRTLDQKILYPRGVFTEVYFSEELKAAEKLGYKITLLKGQSFSRAKMFNNYIEDFYLIKKTSASDSPERFIAKLHLNTLYGIFGKTRDILETKIINIKDITKYLVSRVVETIVEVQLDLVILLLKNSRNVEGLKQLKDDYVCSNISSKFKNNATLVKSNVAIASAVTAYARCEMIKYKCTEGINVYYSDTDSIVTDKPLPTTTELGGLKNEMLKHGVEKISEAYFIGPKEYALKIINKKGEEKIFTTFAGVKKDSLTWNQILQIVKGEEVIVKSYNRFYRSFQALTIKIKNEVEIKIKAKPNKVLKDNNYLVQTVHEFNHPYLEDRSNASEVNILFNKFKQFIAKYVKIII